MVNSGKSATLGKWKKREKCLPGTKLHSTLKAGIKSLTLIEDVKGSM